MPAPQRTYLHAMPTLGVFLLAGACFFSPFRFFRVPGPITIALSDFFLLGALLISLWGAFSGKYQIRITAAYAFSSVLLLIGAVITWVSHPVIENIYTGVKFLSSIILVPMVCAWVIRGGWWEMKIGMASLIAGNLLLAVIAAANSQGVYIFEFLGDSAYTSSRQSGPSHHPIWMANTCLITFPLIFFFLFKHGSGPLTRLSMLMVGFVFIYAILISGSRSALVGLLFSVIPVLVILLSRINSLSGRILGWSGIIISLTISVLVFLILMTDQQFIDQESAFNRLFFSAGSADYSSSKRIFYMNYAWDEFLENPLTGVGFQAIWLAHSAILSVMHTAGLTTLVAYLLWHAACLLGFLNLNVYYRKLNEDWNHRLLLAVLFGSFLAWIVNGQMQALVAERSGYYVVGLMFALYLYRSSYRNAPIQS